MLFSENPGSSTQQTQSCMATYLPSCKSSKKGVKKLVITILKQFFLYLNNTKEICQFKHFWFLSRSLYCILTFERAVIQEFFYTGCPHVNKWKKFTWIDNWMNARHYEIIYTRVPKSDMVSLAVIPRVTVSHGEWPAGLQGSSGPQRNPVEYLLSRKQRCKAWV